jgi:hypothetical protein
VSDPSLALQKALVAALKTALAGAPVSGRVFDRAPPDAPFPYVTLGEMEPNEDGADCIDGVEIFFDIQVWTETVGHPQAKAIGSAVKTALHEADLDLEGHALVGLYWRGTFYRREADGLSSSAIVQFRALTEAAP